MFSYKESEKGPMKLGVYKQGKKCISILLALVILLQCGVLTPIPARSATSAEASGRLTLGNRMMDYTQKLVDNGDGSFSLTLTFKDTTNVEDQNAAHNTSHNAFFTAPTDGHYYIQLWGGDGSNGSKPDAGAAGVGGKGGYVYGVVYLKKGQTLFYQLGGKGELTDNTTTGGGANGNGGNAGTTAPQLVGGGGGYSAVYVFEPGEFESKYLDLKGNLAVDMISEEDRTSKYLMIAGGGGGGGAGSGLANGFIGDDGNPPSGGIGGTIGVSSSDILPDGGTYFAGGNGLSSGTSTANVGQGGTDVPGEVNAAILNWFKGTQPNDWVRSYNDETPGGNGGAGDLRGGGGGAGYTGGSGGVQGVLPQNVGGGGGGSSYVAANVDFSQTLPQGENPGNGFGGIIIQALDTKELTNFSLAFQLTEYFDVTVNGEAVENGEYRGSWDQILGVNEPLTIHFTPKNGFAGGNGVPLLIGDKIDVAAVIGGVTESETLTLDADCAMVNVPLRLEVVTYSYVTDQTNVTYGVNVSENCLHNTLQPTEFLNVAAYEVAYEGPGNTAGAPNYTPSEKGIHSYTYAYEVAPLKKAAKVGTPVGTSETISGTATVRILSETSHEVTTNSGASLIITKELKYENDQYVLSIHVEGEKSELIEGNVVTPQVAPWEKVYTEALDKQDNDSQVADNFAVLTYDVNYSGYYYIQAWGGDGGSGQKNESDNSPGVGGYGAYLEGAVLLPAGTRITVYIGNVGSSEKDTVSESGSTKAGGGGYHTRVVANIPGEGDVTLMIAGGGGGGGGVEPKTWFLDSGHSGLGRTENVYKLSGIYSGMPVNGYNMDVPEVNHYGEMVPQIVNCNPTLVAPGTDLSVYNGEAGQGGDGYKYDSKNPWAGDAGKSYLNESRVISTVGDVDLSAYGFTSYKTCTTADVRDDDNKVDTYALTNSDTVGGAVYINAVQLNPQYTQNSVGVTAANSTVSAAFAEYDFTARISKYFTVNSVVGTNNQVGAPDLTTDYRTALVDKNGNELSDVNAIADTLVSITDVTPNVVLTSVITNQTTQATTVTGTVDYTINIYLTPRTGFLGGNDVPLLNGASLSVPGGQKVDLEAVPETDYANVAIDQTKIGTLKANPNESERTITQDSTPPKGIAPSKLYVWDNAPTIPDEPTSGSWIYDYVKTVTTITRKGDSTDVSGSAEIVPNPLVSTMYTVTVGLAPTKEAEWAVVIDSVSPETISQDVELIVLPRIEYILTNVGTSDELSPPLTDEDGNIHYYYHIDNPKYSHTATLTADPGYVMESVRVYGFVAASNQVEEITTAVNYNPTTGQFTIPVDYLVGTITVTAVATPQRFSITFYQQTNPGEQTFNKLDKDYQFEAGADLSTVVFPQNPTATYPGYDFQWYWGDWDPNNDTTEDGKPSVMPGKNMVVYGAYVAKVYNVTVYYYIEGTTTPVPGSQAKTLKLSYGTIHKEYAISFDGYIPVTQYAELTVDDTGNQTIVLYYRVATGNLTIYYSYENGKYPDQFASHTIQTNQPYQIEVLPQTGYTMSITDAEGNPISLDNGYLKGTPTADQVNAGIAVYVRYTPNTYQVNFDSNGGSEITAPYRVEYHNVYNYNAFTNTMEGLPTPVRAGYTFLGWYVGDELFDGSQTVTTTEAISLTAKWKQNAGKVIIRFEDEFGRELDEQVERTGDIGRNEIYGTFSYKIEKDGVTYTTLTYSVSYTFQAQNQVFVVTYYAPKMLTVQFVDADGKLLYQAPAEYVTVGTEYSVRVETDSEGYFTVDGKAYMPLINPVTGTMPTRDLLIQVDCNAKDIQAVVSVTISWGSMQFDYDPGTWNPQTHTYEGNKFAVVDESNTIQVKNNQDASNVAVTVDATYGAKAQKYENVQGKLTTGTFSGSTPFMKQTLNVGESISIYLWLSGTMPEEHTSGDPVGICTVTISTGGNQ